jgi:plastocyanin
VKRLAAVIGMVVCVIGGAACASSSSKASTQQGPVDLRGRTHVDVDAPDNVFTPHEIIISPATTVTWHNRDTVAHNIKSADGAFGVDAGQFGAGASYSFAFRNAGTFDYTCSIHTGMDGRVRVE